MTTNLVIFDLDGTLTLSRPSSTAPFSRTLLPNVREKCAALREAGVTLAVATNQGGARMGRVPRLPVRAVLEQLRWIKQELDIAQSCFTIDAACKKPNPVMLTVLMKDLGVTPDETLFVGDAESDRLAAAAAGCEFRWAADYFEEEL